MSDRWWEGTGWGALRRPCSPIGWDRVPSLPAGTQETATPYAGRTAVWCQAVGKRLIYRGICRVSVEEVRIVAQDEDGGFYTVRTSYWRGWPELDL